MPFITSFERVGLEKGLEQGRQEGRQEGIQKGRQEGRQEGIQKGRQEGQTNLIVRMLKRRWGTLDPELEIRLSSLSLAQLESLGETFLEFRAPSDLQRWLDDTANRVN